MKSVEEILSATREHAVVFENRGSACFDVSGADGLDLLHRLSTNDLLSGSLPRVRRSILTTEKGRIVDLVRLVIAETGTRLLLSAGARQTVVEWVGKFTITEDISLTDSSDEVAIVYIVGYQALDMAKEILGLPEVTSCVEVSHPVLRKIFFWNENFGTIAGGALLIRRESIGEFFAAAAIPGGVLRLDHPDEMETLRILAGEPAYGHELTDRFNPLEVGLRNAVNFTKGCYVGQEVIARLDSYNKVQRELVALDIRGSTSEARSGDDLVADGESVGTLTSISPLALVDGRRRGLAVVRRSTGPRSTTIQVLAQAGNVNADIVPGHPLEGPGEGKG
jgi:folate-binding protein YgfZ